MEAISIGAALNIDLELEFNSQSYLALAFNLVDLHNVVLILSFDRFMSNIYPEHSFTSPSSARLFYIIILYVFN